MFGTKSKGKRKWNCFSRRDKSQGGEGTLKYIWVTGGGPMANLWTGGKAGVCPVPFSEGRGRPSPLPDLLTTPPPITTGYGINGDMQDFPLGSWVLGSWQLASRKEQQKTFSFFLYVLELQDIVVAKQWALATWVWSPFSLLNSWGKLLWPL